MQDKKDKVFGNELKLKAIKTDRGYLQRLENKELPEREPNKNKVSNGDNNSEDTVFILPMGKIA